MRFCIAGAGIFSTCSRKQYFAILLDSRGHVLSTGTNGVPSGFVHCDEGGCPRVTADPEHGSGYDNCWAIHAEPNCFLHSDYSARTVGGTTLIVNGPPCFSCAKLIANSKVAKVVFLPDDAYADWPRIAGFLEQANVSLVQVDRGWLDPE